MQPSQRIDYADISTQSTPQELRTGFALCCVLLWLCTYRFTHISQGYLTSTGAIIQLHQFRCSNPEKCDMMASCDMETQLLALCAGIHLSSVDSPHKGPVKRKAFPCHGDIMEIGPRLLPSANWFNDLFVVSGYHSSPTNCPTITTYISDYGQWVLKYMACYHCYSLTCNAVVCQQE